MVKLHSGLAIGLLLASSGAVAVEAGDWLIRARLININPNDDSGVVTVNGANALNSSTVSVDDDTTLDLDITYMAAQNWGVELLLDPSSKHDVSGNGLLGQAAPGVILESRVLPPALILQYHPLPQGQLRPYMGLGLNYTLFFDESASTSLNNATTALGLGRIEDVNLKNSWGVVAQIGADMAINQDWFVNVDVKYIDIDTEAKLQTAAGPVIRTSVNIDPWVIGIGIGRVF